MLKPSHERTAQIILRHLQLRRVYFFVADPVEFVKELGQCTVRDGVLCRSGCSEASDEFIRRERTVGAVRVRMFFAEDDEKPEHAPAEDRVHHLGRKHIGRNPWQLNDLSDSDGRLN